MTGDGVNTPDNRAIVQPLADGESRPEVPQENGENAADLWEQCKELALEARILDRFAEDLERAGATGEDRIGKLLFLSIVSRFLEYLVSIAVKGTSSGGKSELVDRVLSFFPVAAYLKITAMSERVLAYDTENVKHRMLVITEAVALLSNFASYLLRTLLSEGLIDYRVVEKKNGEFSCRHISREGPTGLILTTTRNKIHPENETRLLSVTINDSPEQTRKVLKKIAERAGARTLPRGLPDVETWHALHKWIELQEHRVEIPFAKILPELFPITATRIRRDFSLILSLVKSHAILHQATREKNNEGWIIANVEDYSVVRELVDDLIAEGIEASVPPGVRETVAAVKRLLAEFSSARAALQVEGLVESPSQVTGKRVAERLGIDRSAASRRIRHAISAGYLINAEQKQGRPMALQIGEPMPADRSVLPTAADVQRLMDSCTVARLPGGREQTPSDSDETQENSASFEL